MKQIKSELDQIELDLGRYELRRRGKRVKLEKKPMELLILLVSRREQLVTRTDIIAKLWGSGHFIDVEPNINNIVRKIRTALGDSSEKPRFLETVVGNSSEKPRFLETVVGKGYRFVGPVRVISPQHTQSQFAAELGGAFYPAASRMTTPRSSLAVLPLLLAGGGTDDLGLCLGIADALVSRLGNLQGIDVLPTTGVINVPPSATASETATQLGVRFVVGGAIQMFKGQWRLSMEMFDAHPQRVTFRRKFDVDVGSLNDLEDEIARQIAANLHRPLAPPARDRRPRYSRDPMAYAEFMRGFRLSSSGDPTVLNQASAHLANAVTRDPSFSLAHAELSLACATRHFETDPANVWLEKAEFHCQRALELDPDLPEGHVARAFLLWGPSKNFQHLEAISELKRALNLQVNLPHAYNRLGTILAHVGLLEQARSMYERARAFHPRKMVSHSIVQVYVWNFELEQARQELDAWLAESPNNKYPIYFASQVAILEEEWERAETLLENAARLLPEEPMIFSLRGVFHALTGNEAWALDCVAKACAIPKSFGHSHHTYYQIAGILSVLGRTKSAMEWLERSVTTGFACWPFFLKDLCLMNLRTLSDFELLVNSLQAKYPDHLGLV